MHGYFSRLLRQGISTNIGTYVGSSQIWTYVRGEKAGPPTAEELRIGRAVQALEWCGTVEARAVLRRWADGDASFVPPLDRGGLGELHPLTGWTYGRSQRPAHQTWKIDLMGGTRTTSLQARS